VLAVFSLIPDAALRAVYHSGCYFLSFDSRKAVEKNGVPSVVYFHQRVVHLIRGQELYPFISFVILSHRYPYVGIYRVRAGNRGNVRADGYLRTGSGGKRSALFPQYRVGIKLRRCHNCKKFFLLTAGYNTCYCNDIAPGETERTCRKVGAHKKAATNEKTPAQMEYQRVYNRLKTKKSRGKISVDEWNAAVAQALDVKDRAERGELSDDEIRAAFEEMGRG